MDEEKAAAVLDWWIANATAACATGNSGSPGGRYPFGYEGSPAVDALREREDQTRRVIARVNKSTTLPVLLQRFSNNAVNIVAGIEEAKYALGRLRSDAETRAILGPTAPRMAADGLHQTIWNTAAPLWEGGHYRAAVQKAATQLNAEIQTRVSRYDVSDVELMQQTFSANAPVEGKPRLWWPGVDSDLTVKAMRGGILNFAQGVFSAIRNPATHTTDDLPRQEALEQLATLSTLARWIDRCELVEA